MTTVLLTSIGSRSAIGVVQSLAEIRSEIRLVATNSNPNAAGNYLADRTILVPKTAEVEAWIAAVARLIREERPSVVLTGRDEELPLLAQLKDQFPEVLFLVPPQRLIRTFVDKYETFLFARNNDLPFADSAVDEIDVRQLARRHGFPLLAKLRKGGHASRSVYLVTDERQLQECLDLGGFVFQEVVGKDTFANSLKAWSGHLGIPWKWSFDSLDHGIDMVLDRETVVDSCLSRGFTQGGMHINLELVNEPAMDAALEKFAATFGALGHVGPLNVQGKLQPDGRYVPYELNARFVGTTIARTHLGRNLVLSALKHFSVLPGAVERAHPQAASQAVERNFLFMTFPRSAVQDLVRTGDWQKSAGGQ